jgi:hypothetical protein
VEWEEEPFEWVRPSRFGVVRHYRTGPLAGMRVLAELRDRAEGGTHLRYEVWASPRNWWGWLPVRLQLLESGWRFRGTVFRYDRRIRTGEAVDARHSGGRASAVASEKLRHYARRLETAGTMPGVVQELMDWIETAADVDLEAMRPYALARRWRLPRRAVLEGFLHATSIGALELRWQLLCPLCRGAKQSSDSLETVNANVHCEACQIDFSVNFNQSIEAVFRPAPDLRRVDSSRYCVGGPQTQPHIVTQQVLEPGTARALRITLDPGTYRFRRWGAVNGQIVRVLNGPGPTSVSLDSESRIAIEANREVELSFHNASTEDGVFLLEQMAWGDQAATAAEVTSLQLFRDLFSQETLRPAERIEARSLSVLVTAFHDAVSRFRELGDQAAFACSIRHQQVVVEEAARHGGAFVKVLANGTLSVFPHAEDASEAATAILHRNADEELRIKAAICTGPMLAVRLNDRLDYFGAVVSEAESLVEQASPGEVVGKETAVVG